MATEKVKLLTNISKKMFSQLALATLSGGRFGTWASGLLYVRCNAGVTYMYKEYEPRHEKTNILHMRKQRRRSASR